MPRPPRLRSRTRTPARRLPRKDEDSRDPPSRNWGANLTRDGAPFGSRPRLEAVSLPPSPRLPPPLQLLGFFSRPTAFMERCHERYGDMFTLRMPGSEPMVFLADPGL